MKNDRHILNSFSLIILNNTILLKRKEKTFFPSFFISFWLWPNWRGNGAKTCKRNFWNTINVNTLWNIVVYYFFFCQNFETSVNFTMLKITKQLFRILKKQFLLGLARFLFYNKSCFPIRFEKVSQRTSRDSILHNFPGNEMDFFSQNQDQTKRFLFSLLRTHKLCNVSAGNQISQV